MSTIDAASDAAAVMDSAVDATVTDATADAAPDATPDAAPTTCDLDCEDDNPCTADTCDVEAQECVHTTADPECTLELCRIYVDGSAPSGGDGASWTTAIDDLRAALNAAATLPHGCTTMDVWVKEGRYVPDPSSRSTSFVIGNGVRLYGGFEGNETALTQRAPRTDVTELSGDIDGDDVRGDGYPGRADETTLDDNAQRVVTFASGVSSATVIDGVMITGGYNDGDGFGGGLLNDGGDPTINDVIVQYNWVVTTGPNEGGGGFMNRGGAPSLTNVIFNSNVVRPDGQGSAIGGGGMYNNGGSPTIRSTTFWFNAVLDSPSASAHRGGGGLLLFNAIGEPDVHPELVSLWFLDNQSGDHGHAESGGAGLLALGSHAALVNVEFLGNVAAGTSRGGGMYVLAFGTPAFPALTNTTFSANRAGNGGGGLYLLETDDQVPIVNSVFFGNGTEISGDGAMVSYSCISGWTAGGTQNLDCATLPFVDERYALPLPGSLIHNAGSDAANAEPTDVVGYPRKVGTIDIGAHELQQ